MADFNISHMKTLNFEGGYVNDPVDAGGETYKGVARKFNPTWDGWKIIDSIKTTLTNINHLPRLLDQNVHLQNKVKELFKMKYWDPFCGDDMPQSLANEMFDTGVNMGVGRTVKFLQKALNVLNRNETLYPDMVEDGDYGPTTHRHLHEYLVYDSEDYLVKIINILQGAHYIEYMTKSPVQERFARGWLNRVTFSKV